MGFIIVHIKEKILFLKRIRAVFFIYLFISLLFSWQTSNKWRLLINTGTLNNFDPTRTIKSEPQFLLSLEIDKLKKKIKSLFSIDYCKKAFLNKIKKYVYFQLILFTPIFVYWTGTYISLKKMNYDRFSLKFVEQFFLSPPTKSIKYSKT